MSLQLLQMHKVSSFWVDKKWHVYCAAFFLVGCFDRYFGRFRNRDGTALGTCFALPFSSSSTLSFIRILYVVSIACTLKCFEYTVSTCQLTICSRHGSFPLHQSGCVTRGHEQKAFLPTVSRMTAGNKTGSVVIFLFYVRRVRACIIMFCHVTYSAC